MTPTDTDRFLAEIRGAAEGGAQIMPYDVLRIFEILEELGRENLRLRAEGSTPSLSCHPHCALFKGLPLPPGVLSEVLAERERQEAKWGQQNHPWHVPGLSTESVRAELRIPSSTEARDYVQSLADYGILSYSAILLEEVCGAVDESDDQLARKELIQVAAVAVAAVEAIDRRLPPPAKSPEDRWLKSALAREQELGELPPNGASGGAVRSRVCPDCRGRGIVGHDLCFTCAGNGLIVGGP